MIEEFRFLPWSGRRYRVSQYGKIYSQADEIETVKDSEHQVVELEWILGKRFYDVALLVIVAFQGLNLPAHFFDQIEPLYVDGCSENLSPNNLLYRFRCGRIEVEDLPGFYYIPFYTEYAIAENGSLVNVNTRKHKSWSITKGGGLKNQTGGYLYNRVVSDEGVSKTLFMHRALCYVFKHYENNVMSLVVNHKDGRPSNNKLDNLEFVTYKRNNQHAYENELRGNSARPVLMKCLKTGNVSRFESIQACGRELGVDRADYIRMRLLKGPSKVYEDLLVFKYDDGTPWPEVDLGKIVRSGYASDIIARNVFTGETFIFSGTVEGSVITNVKSATILRHVRENAVVPVKGYNFRYLDMLGEWPEHNNKCLKIYEKYPVSPPDGLEVTDSVTGKETFFLSVAEACQSLKIVKSSIYNCIRTGTRYNNRYTFKLFEIRKSLGHPIE